MPQCNAFRSLTVLLLIKLAVESQVDAFTIQRIVESTFQPSLIISDSNLNQKEKAFDVIDISNVKQESNNTFPETNNTIQVAENIEEAHNKATEKIETLQNFTETPDVKATEKILNLTTNDITIDVVSSSTTQTEEESERDYEESSTVTGSETASTESTASISSTLEDDFVSTSESTGSSDQLVTVTDVEGNTKKSSGNLTLVNRSTGYTSSTGILNEEDSTQQKYETIKTEVDNDSYSTRTVVTKNTTKFAISSPKIDDYSPQESSTASTPKSLSDNLVYEASEYNVQDTTTDQISAERESTTLTTANRSEPIVPYWKKYIEIDRKRLSSAEPVESSTNGLETLVHAESGQSSPTMSPSLEKAFNIPFNISPSDKLTNAPLALTSEFSTYVPIRSGTDPVNTLKSTETMQVADATAALQTTSDLPRPEVVSSLRGGYLDYSSRSTGEPETTTFEGKYLTVETDANFVNLSEELSTEIGSTESSNNETSVAVVTTASTLRSTTSNQETTSKNINITQGVIGLASQSQLAEDAINEELMKEEILTDNVEYSKSYRDGRFDVKTLNNKETLSTYKPQIIQPEDTLIDDKLSVKPISYEKKNISSLYTVNPNYKPLKKIDVQPSKSFLRDPDDNSWRNESLSTLGIVFKAKNTSKAFTQVLKNKTEMQQNSLSDTKSEEQSPELRIRLEKIAEERKSKKKKTDYFGNTYYTDYEENTSNERTTTRKTNVFDDIMSRFTELTTMAPDKSNVEPLEINKIKLNDSVDTFKPMAKQKKVVEEYESDEDEIDYVHDIDLKKFKTKNNYVTPKAPFFKTISKTTTSPTVELETTVSHYLPERKPTVQYFPPRERPKVVVNEYDDSFRSKVNEYTFSKQQSPLVVNDIPPTTLLPTYVPWNRSPQQRPKSTWQSNPDSDKNIYVTHPTINQNLEKVRTDGYHRPSYLIKHLKDFINDVAKDDDAYVTEIPYIGVTATNEGRKRVKVKPPADYYDYEAQFRKDVLDRFVENFNQHSERFKVDFPVLYNTSVVHSKLADEGRGAIASSSAFMKRLYEDTHALNGASATKRFDPNCDKTIELSPAYELHYYVPEEEEKEVQERKLSNTSPYTNVPSPYMLRL